MLFPNKKLLYPLEPLFGQILSPFERFLRRTTAGGIVLIATSILTLLIANSNWGSAFHYFWEQPLTLGVGEWTLTLTLHHWVNDGLMALFFLLVGLEIKREILVGELSSIQDAALPIGAAIGGMAVPALVYMAFNAGTPTASGWGIPMATDIAFAIGILVLLAWRVPRSLIIFMTALAIADDLGAVFVIALFYTHGIDMTALLSAGGMLILLVLFNRGGIRHALPYVLVGAIMWYLTLKSGLHATIAGILLALCIPARPAFSPAQFDQRLKELSGKFHIVVLDPNTPDTPLSNHRMATIAENVELAAVAVQPPLQRMEHGLSAWVTFLVIPIFALANAGIDFSSINIGRSIGEPVTLGVMAGLVIGKFVGISLGSWLVIKSALGRMPHGMNWRHLTGAAWLGGIGFTMSLFIGGMAFSDPQHFEDAKLGILASSLLAALIGLAWLYVGSGKQDA
ncbi:MAG: Na+/H+ antiporter NhaA [Sulfuricellaceae bacterium]|nr:Na+/H+ antiporter NhaA [Sulfuricellaceae bacterium]